MDITITTQQEAVQIMGANYHGPETLVRHLGVSSRMEDSDIFATIPFDGETLRACRETHVLVACGLRSLAQLSDSRPDEFAYRDDLWGEELTGIWARARAKPGWHLVRKGHVPDSTGKNLNAQEALLSPNEQVPSALVLAQANLLHYLETGEKVLSIVAVRVSDVSPNTTGRKPSTSFRGLILGVGYAHGCFFLVGSGSRNRKYAAIGVASEVKPIN